MNKTLLSMLAAASLGFTTAAMAHGDVVPQGANTDGLEPLGAEWLDENPYRTADEEIKALAVRIGDGAYNQNCARCHGLEAMSGGIAPDLRELDADINGDEWFKERVINGATRNGAIYMPRMAEHLSQEALWAIRTYIEKRAADTL